MKDSRFIELVNLYIDRQITAEETAELEAEMQGHPRRRAVYRRYCQLHSATKQVYDRFRAHAEPVPAVPAGRAGLARFERQPRRHWIHYAGGLAAAAAGLAFVLVRYDGGTPPATAPIAQVETKQPVATAVTVAPVAAEQAPSLLSLERGPAVEREFSALLAALREEEQNVFTNPEIQATRLPSLFDDGVFEERPLLPLNGQRTFRSKHTPAQKAEFTAFQFQR
ncbi:MAG: hypothetical protein HYX71_00595 [Opitutae bacterium]|nr:hypothetical protein [Opitutae bacterium]